MKFIIFLSALVAVAFSAVIRMPVTRVTTQQQRHHSTVLRGDRFPRSTGTQPFINYDINLFVGNLTIGTPPKSFTVLLDTGSADFWVVDIGCTGRGCDGKDKFDSSKSSTFDFDPHHMNYSTQEEFHGWGGVDVVNFGGIALKSQEFGLITRKQHIVDLDDITKIDGQLGLGWRSLSNQGMTPPMQNLQPLLDLPVFTIWLDDGTAWHSQPPLSGVVTYGAVDNINCESEVNYVTLSARNYWQFPVNGFQYGAYSATARTEAYVHTRLTYIGAPEGPFNAIIKANGAVYDHATSQYTLPCHGKYPDLSFTIGGKNYVIPSRGYVMDANRGDGKCIMAIFNMLTSGFGPEWAFGDVWMRQYCNIHDFGLGRMGFAKALHTI